jgi:hypothetical protein
MRAQALVAFHLETGQWVSADRAARATRRLAKRFYSFTAKEMRSAMLAEFTLDGGSYDAAAEVLNPRRRIGC